MLIERHFNDQRHMGKQFEELVTPERWIKNTYDRAQCHTVGADYYCFILAKRQHIVERCHVAPSHVVEAFAS